MTAMTLSDSTPSPNRCVDLRSDTVTRPTRAMREAMMAAEVGDDVFHDDPSVNALQDKIADLLGFEAALFMPTGTQSNLCGILSHCERGDEFLVGQMAHEAHGVGQRDAALGLRQEHLAGGGVQGGEQLVGGIGAGLGQRIEQGGFASVGVADQGHGQHFAPAAGTAAHGALPFQNPQAVF